MGDKGKHKKILMIAPASFPVTSAECIVNIKLLQAMSKSSQFDIDLISKDIQWHNYPSDALESYNIHLNSLNIITVSNRLNIKTIWQHFLSFIYFRTVYKGSHWAAKALTTAKELVRKNTYDYVLTKNESSFLIGFWLKKHYNIKWIATWNDPFPKILYPDAYIRYWNIRKKPSDKRVIKIMRRYVDIHVFPNDRLRDHMNKTLNIDPDKTAVIPHIVLSTANEHERKENDGILKLIHSGNIGYPRDPELFFTALEQFFVNHPDAKLKVDILGVTGQDITDSINRHSLEKHVQTIAPVTYHKSMDMLADYDIAVIIEAECKEGIFLPTKVSDFMQNGIPIFAISPEQGVLNDLYKNGNIPYFASNEDINQIRLQIEKIYDDYLNTRIGAGNVIPSNYTEKSVTDFYLSF